MDCCHTKVKPSETEHALAFTYPMEDLFLFSLVVSSRRSLGFVCVEDGANVDDSANLDGLGSGRKQIDDVVEDCIEPPLPPPGFMRVIVAAGVSGTLLLQVIAFKSITLLSGETTGDKSAGIPSSNGNGGLSSWVITIISGLMG